MSISKRAFLFCFFGGLCAFAITIYLHLPLMVDGVPEGIAEHQRAPDAATVNAIHDAWKGAGVFDQARLAMISDLIFIGIYGIGCVLGGFYYRNNSNRLLRVLGWIALIAGAVFMVTDYAETVAQFIQLSRDAGSDGLAQLASSVRPTKMITWIAAFFAVIAALILERQSFGRA